MKFHPSRKGNVVEEVPHLLAKSVATQLCKVTTSVVLSEVAVFIEHIQDLRMGWMLSEEM